jgi:hypothetical protein
MLPPPDQGGRRLASIFLRSPANNQQAEGEEMSEPLSLSIFTIEADRKPVLAFAAKKHQDAEAFFKDGKGSG